MIERRDPLWMHSTRTNLLLNNDKMNSYTEAESELSLESRWFLHRVNDQVRKRQNQSSKDAKKTATNILWYCDCLCLLHCKHLYSWEKNYSDNWHFIKNTGNNLTMKHMFDISEQLITEQSDEIYGVKTINWEDSLWKYLSFVGDEQVISLSNLQRFMYSQILYYALEKWFENPIVKYCLGTTDWNAFQKFIRIQKLWTESMVSELNSNGISSKDSPHCSSAEKSKIYCQDWA